MKKILTIASLGAVAVLSLGATAFAAQSALYNGGLGQVAANHSQFGVAVCNRGSKDVTAAVPVAINANGKDVAVSSPDSIAAGSCGYTYVDYNAFSMQPATDYSVTVTVNGGDQTVYDLTTPSGALTVNGKLSATANADQQAGNVFSAILNWFIGLFTGR